MGCPYGGRFLGTSGAASKKLPDETHDIGLYLVVRRFEEELGDPARADTVVLPKIPLQDADCLVCRRITEQRLQSGSDIVDARSVS